jgi:hypothetical protein
MSIHRSILALLIALSVAMLPAAGAAGMKSKSPEPSDMSPLEDMLDCCPHKANPCDHAVDDCRAMASCALKCFSFAGTSSSIIVFPSAFAEITAPFVGNSFPLHRTSPPFRPPRS